MTTIAFDGNTLAADSQTTQDGLRLSMQAKKIHLCPSGQTWRVNGIPVWAFGVAGKLSSAHLVETALLEFDDGITVATSFPKGSSLTYLLITQSGEVFVGGQNDDDDQAWLSQVSTPIAIGSGSELAIGAMAAGGDAAMAIEIASRYDTNTGGEIQVHTVGKKNIFSVHSHTYAPL